LEAFFFPTTDNLQLFGVARGPKTARRFWVLCPPFAEEEKSARRVLTLIAQQLEKRGEGSLVFSFRGTGDSEGNFADAHLRGWKDDLRAAVNRAQQLFPEAEGSLIGVRIGASLALQEAAGLGMKQLVLIEPLLAGRSFLMQQSAKKQIRAQLTGEDSSSSKVQTVNADDLDGWALGAEMKAQLSTLDLRRDAAQFVGKTTVIQVGPRTEISPPLQNFADGLGAKTHAVVVPPFWNLIDFSDPAPLLQTLASEVFDD
jgi:alpha/beta superfamily hydrolase